MKTKLIKSGDSWAVRIPESLIEECGLGEEVELSVRSGSIVISAVSQVRKGWEEAFQALHSRSDDTLLLPGLNNEWDETEWEWN